ncbi:hypothetical protein FOZ60_006591 [Perkinsus olseni]|uniref:C2 domain-containing protein n=4 Tax=Perkinsus olseni TaxID=32597 RepID=A0A7J6NN93_PEROL|nr:hypothetical protein FOZ60_006591 [Perkinsus olseni]
MLHSQAEMLERLVRGAVRIENVMPVAISVLNNMNAVSAHSELVLIEIMSQGDRNDMIAAADFDFQAIYEKGMNPRWVNLYYSIEDDEAVPPQVNDEPLESEYGGRILVSASVERSEDPQSSVVTCDAPREPETKEHVVWIDVYEAAFTPEFYDEVQAQEVFVEFTFGTHAIRTPARELDGLSAIFEEEGRLRPFQVFLPEFRQSFDLKIELLGKKIEADDDEWDALAFTRLSLPDIKTWNDSVVWRKLYMLSVPEDMDQVAAHILCGVNAGCKPFPQRPLRMAYNVREYVVRGFFYQAVNLPISDPGGLSDPFVKMSIGGISGRTDHIPTTLNPQWREILEFPVILPADPKLQPDLYVEVCDADDSVYELMCSMSCPASEVPEEWNRPPKWFALEPSSRHPHAQAQILAAFELLPVEDAAKHAPFCEEIQPRVNRCEVEVLTVGVRLIKDELTDINPRLQLWWNRDDDNAELPVEEIVSEEAESGSGGQYNMLEVQPMILDLPQSALYQEFLEVRLLERVEGGWLSTEEKDEVIGFGYIHLNPLYPWLTDEEKEKCRESFTLKTPTQLRREEALREQAKNEKKLIQEKRLEQEAARAKTHGNTPGSQDLLRKIELEIERRFGLRKGEFGLTDVLRNITTERMLAFSQVTDQKSDGFDFGLDTAEVDENFYQSFVWPLKTSAGFARREIDGPVEEELLEEELPYDTIVLFRGNKWGSFDTLGYLKYKLRIGQPMNKRRNQKKGRRGSGTQRGEETERDVGLQRAYLPLLRQEYLASHSLVCKVYVLSASGIIPPGGSTDCESYIWIYNSKEEAAGGLNSIKDSSNSRTSTLNPEFNKCYSLPCRFPDNTALTIKLMEKHSLTGDTTIGAAVIDIENRWFHPRYKQMMNLDSEDENAMKSASDVPVETVPLLVDGSFIPTGRLKMWVEILDESEAMGRPEPVLPSANKEIIQARLVVWKTKGVPPPEDEEASHQIVGGFHRSDSNVEIDVFTDTHYGSLDGTATFNWRMLFDMEVPCHDPVIKLQLYHNPLLGQKVPLGEATLDLVHDTLRCRRIRRAVELPRGQIPLSNPAYPGQCRGFIDCQMKLLPIEEASAMPVGSGRDTPNKDPYLDPEDAHLREHRSALGNTAFGRRAKELGESLMKGAKVMFYVWMLTATVGGIVSLIIALKMSGII